MADELQIDRNQQRREVLANTPVLPVWCMAYLTQLPCRLSAMGSRVH